MTYSGEISREKPSCFLFLIDQSGSMDDPFADGNLGKTKADTVADILNRLLQNIAIKCAKEEGIRDYYHIGAIGYGKKVGSAFGGMFESRDLVPISELADNPVRIEERRVKFEDGAGGIVERSVKFPVWVESTADGGTPMCKSLAYAKDILTWWLQKYPDCFPPIVFNLTDGEATDGDPSGPAQELRNLASSDGNVLLFNIHASSRNAEKIVFPGSDASLPDEYAKLLFEMSSLLPDNMQKNAYNEGIGVSSSSRGFAFNADPVAIITCLDIGTRPVNLR